jgi:hypothetical protein
MTLWTSVITVVLFSFLVIGVDEYWHWLRRRRKERQQQGAEKLHRPS